MSAISETFQIAVVFSAIDHLSGPMQRMAGQMGLCSQRTEALQNKLNGFKNMMFVGGGITAIGAVMAGGLKHAVDAAGQLQSSLMGVRQSLGLTQTQFRNLQNVVMTEGLKTAFSAVQMGQLTEGMVGGGMGKVVTASLDPQSVARKVLREYIAYADVRYLGSSHENPRESVATAAQMAHSYGVYDAEGTRKFLNTLNAALASYHGNSAEFNTQFGYYAGTAKTIGMSMDDAITTEAFMGRLGLGAGRGGTNINQFLQKILPSGQKKHDSALREAGFLDEKGHSRFFDGNKFAGWERASAVLQQFDKTFKDIAVKNRLMTSVFNEFGKRVAFKVMDKGSMEQLHNVRSEMAKVASITAQQEERNKSWEGQMKQFSSVTHDVVIQFGLGLMPIAQKLAGKLNEIAAAVLEWTIHNPKIVEMAATWASWAAGIALVVGPLLIIRGAMGYLFSSGLILTGIKMVWAAFRGFFGWQTLAMGVLYTAWVNNWGHIQEAAREALESVKGYVTDNSNQVTAIWKKKGKVFQHVASQMQIDWKAACDAISMYTDDNSSQVGAKWAEAAKKPVKVIRIWGHDIKVTGTKFQHVSSQATIDWKAFCDSVKTNWAEAVESVLSGMDNITMMMGGKSRAQVKGEQVAAELSARYMKHYTKNKKLTPGLIDNVHNFNTQYGTTMNDAAKKQVLLNELPKWWDTSGAPAYASGTDFARGGWSMVGERGPELVNLRRGSQVIPNHRLGGGGVYIAEGAIHVHGAPGQSEEALADAVARRLGQVLRNRSYASPDAVLSAW